MWWKLSRSLLHKPEGAGSVPALNTEDGGWIFDASGKANVFAKVFSKKSALPAQHDNEYSMVAVRGVSQSGFLPVRLRCAKRELATLNVNSANGPDKLGCRILKECSAPLCVAVLSVQLAI